MKTILITGGAGFVGSNLALLFKQSHSDHRIVALDNLKRRGSELNLARLKASGIEFVHGDIRNREDLLSLPHVDIFLECSAEPSVLAGLDGSPDYLLSTNLVGTLNCLELARRDQCDFIFLSTSRVYPMRPIDALEYEETDTRFELADQQGVPGVSKLGFSEIFPLNGVRSLYGASKLASELIIQEYVDAYGLRALINRCGILTGPWQMGKVDQGIIAFWAAAHVYQKNLAYFGYGGKGKQVRDLLHVQDLHRLLITQIEKINELNGNVFNVGGSRKVSVSLAELTQLCQEYSGNKVQIDNQPENRAADIKLYLSDHSAVTQATGWQPEISVDDIVKEMVTWIQSNKEQLQSILT